MNFHTHFTTSLSNLASADVQSLSKRSTAKLTAEYVNGMGNLAQASSHTEFHQPHRLVSQHQHFNFSALTRRKMLRKFYIGTDKEMKHLKSFLRLQVSHTSWDESSACKQRLSSSIPPSVPGTSSAQHTGLRGWELQEAQAAHRLNTISSQGSKMIIDFILIGLSAMSQFKC